MRINKYVALAMGISRRQADDLIAEGRINVNDEVAHFGIKIQDGDTVKKDDEVLLVQPFKYIALHKPVGYLSSKASQGGIPTLYELLPQDLQSLKTAGRLDKDSSGLVLMSDDGDFIHKMTHPSNNKLKAYEVELTKELTEDELAQLASGISIQDQRPSKLKVKPRGGQNYFVEMSEGRNRQIRRTFSAIGNEVIKLHRTEMGDYKLGNIKPGEWEEISR